MAKLIRNGVEYAGTGLPAERDYYVAYFTFRTASCPDQHPVEAISGLAEALEEAISSLNIPTNVSDLVNDLEFVELGDFTWANLPDKPTIPPEHARGAYSYIGAVPDPNSASWNPPIAHGDYIIITADSAENQFYIADLDDNVWVSGGSGGGAMDAATVKMLYESNSNTNAYTDAEKSAAATASTNASSALSQLASKQNATEAGDNGKVLVGGSTAGTFGTSQSITSVINNTASLTRSSAVKTYVDAADTLLGDAVSALQTEIAGVSTIIDQLLAAQGA